MSSIIDQIVKPHGGSGEKSRGKSGIKMVSCIIRPEKLDAVNQALGALNLVGGMTVSDVKGFGRQKGHVEHYRGGTLQVRFNGKIRVELAVPEDDAQEVVQTIQSVAQTGNVGDGKIFVTDLLQVMRIRTGERGSSAL